MPSQRSTMFISLLKNYVIDHYVMLFELVGLLVMLKVSIHVSRRAKRITLAVIMLIFIESVAFDAETYTQSFATLSMWRPMLTAFIYSIFPIILFLVTQMTIEKPIPWRMMLVLLLPEIICVPVFFTSQWTHLVCYFTQSNSYLGGKISNLPYFLAGLYIFFFLAQNIYYFRKGSSISRLITAYITVGPTFGMLCYVILDVSDDYTALFVSAIILYYLCLYIHLTRIDPLTHLLNRQCFYQEMHDRADKITVVASIDMNGLKNLNDTQGHEAGDKALKTISDILRDGCGKRGTAYRIGGDEFIIFFFGASAEEAENAVVLMRGKLEKTPYSCAFGLATVENGGVRDALHLADMRMYEDKAATRN